MSTSIVQRLATSMQQADSVGGEKIWAREARELWNVAIAPDVGVPGDDAHPIETGEKKIIQDLLENASLSHSARAFLKDKLENVIPGLLRADSNPAPNPNRPEETTLGTRKPVIINTDGIPLLRGAEDSPTTENLAEGYYQLALMLSHEEQSPQGDLLKSLPLATRRAMLDSALDTARDASQTNTLNGLSQNETSQLRSSAFTTIFAIAKTLPDSGMTQSLRGDAHDALVELAQNETQKLLGNHMARLLMRDDYQSGLSRPQRQACTEIFESRFPQKFDVENILDEEGFISWEHVTGHGEGFFRSFNINILKQNVEGEHFKEVDSGPGYKDFELTFDPPKGDDGQVHGVRLRVRTYSDDMFAAVGERKGFSYGGHSNIGRNQESSLDKAILEGLKATSPQLAMLDLCAGLDGLDDALENLGDVEILTTFSSSFFWKGKLTDEDGTFEGVTMSEGMNGLTALFKSLAREENYEGMRKRVTTAIHHWSHPRNPNVVFPTLQDYKEVRWMHLDGDNDGRMDAGDLFFQFGLRTAALNTPKDAFLLQDSGSYDALNGDTVRDAILDLNVSSHYNAKTHGNARAEHTFTAGGFFDGTDSGELLRFETINNLDGKEVTQISVNSRLAHTSREALSALTQYMTMMHLADEKVLRGVNEEDRKLMALGFATFRLTFDGGSRFSDQRVWKQLLTAMNLPNDLPYGPMAKLIDSESHDYAGNMKIVKKYKESLSASNLEALRSNETGRPTSTSPAIS